MPVQMEDLLSGGSTAVPPSDSSSSLKMPEAAAAPSAASQSPAKPSSSGSAAPKAKIKAEDLMAPTWSNKPKGDGAGLALGKGFATATADTAQLVNLAAAAPAMLADYAKGLITGKKTTEYQDEVFANLVDPIVATKESLQLDPNSGYLAKATYTIGNVLGIINQAILFGPEAAPEVYAARGATGTVTAATMPTTGKVVADAARQGAGIAQVPAVAQAIDLGREVLERTGDKEAAAKAATHKYVTTVASFMGPMAARGSLPARVAQGAAVGGAMGEATRVSMNTALPGDMQQPFSWEGLAEGVIIGGILGPMAGKDPFAPARTLRQMGPEQFDAFASSKPKAAADLVRKAAKTDPKLAQQAATRVVKKNLGLEELKAKGEEAAKKEMGKKLPEQWEFNDEAPKADELLAELETKPEAKPFEEAPKLNTPRHKMSAEEVILREYKAWDVKYRGEHQSDSVDMPGVPFRDTPEFYETGEAHKPFVKSMWSEMGSRGYDTNPAHEIPNDYGIDAHDYFLQLAKNSSGSNVPNLLHRLAPFLKGVKIQGINYDHAELGGAAGHFDPPSGNIRIGIRGTSHLSGQAQFRMLVHEGVHAATYRFLWENPHHQYNKDMRGLLAETKLRVRRMQQDSSLGGTQGDRSLYRRWYGLVNTHEFVSEAFSNPHFQRFLMMSEKYASPQWKAKRLWSTFGNIVKKIVGVDTATEAKLLDSVLQVADDVMQEGARQKSRKAAGKPSPAPKQVSDGLSESVDGIGKTAIEPEKAEGPDPIIYKAGGMPITRSMIKGMTKFGLNAARKVPGFPFAEGKLRAYLEESARTVLPEALGDKAKTTAAIVSKAIAKWKALNAQMEETSGARHAFWNEHHARATEFWDMYESGKKSDYEPFNDFADAYKGMMAYLAEEDGKMGIEYDIQDNYVTHLFKDKEKAAAYLQAKYGSKFGDPYFMKSRIARTIKEMQEAGFELKYANPEDLMRARIQASNIAHAKIEMLRELSQIGLLARAGKDGPPNGWSTKIWRSPNGEKYYAHNQADAILHNAFETKSLWNDQGMLGDAFRGGMWIKNKIVPIRLFGLFHAAHVGLLINNAAALTRAGKMLLAGNIEPKIMGKEVLSGITPLSGMWNSNANRILKAYWGKIPEGELTQGEQRLMTYMQEGGMVPGMAEQDIGNSRTRFVDAVQQGKYGKAAFKLPFAIIDSLQYPMFHIWIPTLKIAAYTRDIAVALHLNPELETNSTARIKAFAEIRKSVDNRFGEMNYDTLFWQRQIKDVAVLTTLSLGWQMGFIREYGGGTLDIGLAVWSEKSIPEIAQKGGLDRTMFAVSYMTSALLLSGVMSYLLSGDKPEGLDWFYPKTGEKDADGKPKRVNTPYYTREFAAIAKHMESEGVGPGLHRLVTNKASGVIGMVKEIAFGVNSLGQEIRDPNGTAFQKLSQTLAYELKSLQPISMQDRGDARTNKEAALSTLGFSPAPKYATESPLVGEIKATYHKYLGSNTTSFDKAEQSKEVRDLREAFKRDDPKYDEILSRIETRFGLTDKEIRTLEKNVQKGSDPALTMFTRLSWQAQKRILDNHWHEMSEEEQDEYLRKSNKEHLRNNYEPPEKGNE